MEIYKHSLFFFFAFHGRAPPGQMYFTGFKLTLVNSQGRSIVSRAVFAALHCTPVWVRLVCKGFWVGTKCSASSVWDPRLSCNTKDSGVHSTCKWIQYFGRLVRIPLSFGITLSQKITTAAVLQSQQLVRYSLMELMQDFRRWSHLHTGHKT